MNKTNGGTNDPARATTPDLSTQIEAELGETLVQYLSKLQFNAAKWAYMKLHGGLGEEEAAAKLFADRQTKAAKIEALIESSNREAVAVALARHNVPLEANNGKGKHSA